MSTFSPDTIVFEFPFTTASEPKTPLQLPSISFKWPKAIFWFPST
jgi:hypothetical protein